MESEIRLRLDPVRLFWYCTGSADGNQDDWLCACLSNDQQWCNTKYMKESINIPASSQEQCRRLTIKHVVASYMALDVPHSCIDLNVPAPASTHTVTRVHTFPSIPRHCSVMTVTCPLAHHMITGAANPKRQVIRFVYKIKEVFTPRKVRV